MGLKARSDDVRNSIGDFASSFRMALEGSAAWFLCSGVPAGISITSRSFLLFSFPA